MDREVAVVTGYIMYNDLLENARGVNDSFIYKIDLAIELAEKFVEKYPEDYNWEELELDFEETIEDFLKPYLL
jgi:hypothetical protein